MPILVTIPKGELYDEINDSFITVDKDIELMMEHNLIAVSRWEMKYHRPYLTESQKTNEEILYYFECMTITKGIEPYLYKCIPKSELIRIDEYIRDPMSGTTVRMPKNGKKETLSSELIYYYMFKLNIPKECENWHLNRLTKLLEVFSVKDGDNSKMSRSERIARNQAINARNKAKYHTKG